MTTDSGQEDAVDYDLRIGKDWRIRMRYDATWKEWQTAVGMKDGESFWYTVPTFPEAVLSFEEEYSSFLDRVEQVHRVMIRRGNWAQSQADEDSAREDDNMGELT